MSNETISVTVQYVGHEDLHKSVHRDTTFAVIKDAAMGAFTLESGAASRYVLQYQGADLPDSGHVASLDQEKVVLSLTLKTEPVKGC